MSMRSLSFPEFRAMTRRLPRAFGFFHALAAVAVAGEAWATEPATLGGRPFAAPGVEVPMPRSWIDAPVTRKARKPVALALSLDQQLYPALLPLIERFARDRDIEIAVQEGTCGTSTGALAEKSADITGFCCPPGETDRLPGLRFHTVGIGSIALLVHPGNPIEGVTADAARRLFGGHARDWGDLPMGGVKLHPKGEVRAITRLHCKSRPGHWRLILDDEDQFGRDVEEVSAIEDMILQVSRNKGAIGYETLYHATLFAESRKAAVRTIKVDGKAPEDQDALAAGKYPFYRVFNITTWSQGPATDPLARELAAWLLAQADAGALDPRYGIVPAARLRANGWKFLDDELVGEPD
jgi:ABC-type phosphate transport system substrate-binding protein